MSIPILCPECAKEYRLRDDMAGRKVKCQACQAIISVPGSPPRTAAPAAGARPATARPAAPAPLAPADDLFGDLPALGGDPLSPSRPAPALPPARRDALAPVSTTAKKKKRTSSKASRSRMPPETNAPWVWAMVGICTLVLIASIVVLVTGKGKKFAPAVAPAANPNLAPVVVAGGGGGDWRPDAGLAAGFSRQVVVDKYRFKLPPAYKEMPARPLPQASGRKVQHKTWVKQGDEQAKHAYLNVVVIDAPGAAWQTTEAAVGAEATRLLDALAAHEKIQSMQRELPQHGRVSGKPIALVRMAGTISILGGLLPSSPANVVALVHVEQDRIVLAYGLCSDAPGTGDYKELEAVLLTLES